MSKKILSIRIASNPYLPGLVALFGGLIFLVQAYLYANSLESNLDEGAYLYKGLLFVTGKYQIYQAYGFWSNHMPMAFFIPGWIQAAFGPSLTVARYFMIFLGCLTVLGMWILGKRLGGNWWAVAAVWSIVMNPAFIKMLSYAVSQGIVACLLTWMLVFAIGEPKPLWQLFLSSILAVIIVMVRINLAPVLPLLLLYVLWQHGVTKGLTTGLVASLIFIGLHALFWPGILQVYTRIFPRGLFAFLDVWRFPFGYDGYWDPDGTWINKLISIFRTVRFHFISVMGVLAACFLSTRKGWRHQSEFRTFIFFIVLFISLFVLHAYAALGMDYCTYCLEGYLAFFSITGILAVIVSARAWDVRPAWYVQIPALISILIITGGVGMAGIEDYKYGVLYVPLPKLLFDFPRLSPGFVSLNTILTNKFSLERSTLHLLDLFISGVALAVLILILAGFVNYIINKTDHSPGIKKPNRLSFSYVAISGFLLCGFLLSPTKLLGGAKFTYDCSGDVLKTYQSTGEALARIIPSGSTVYWRGLSAVPLLYLPDIHIYPPQINGDYSFILDGDPQVLLRHGFWNEALQRQWIGESDFILVEGKYYKGVLKQMLQEGSFNKIVLPPQASCRPASDLYIFMPSTNP